ncbi:MAG: hypothetical protein L6R42_002402 [Xanthoria sp. 1 TBL-2021]|nr:MAG: hypothetical protein L6R42_002402 [Xanthoria sp. 1 TBL-2021]
MEQCSLVRLPGEIRNLIYHHLFSSITVKIIWSRPTPGEDGVFYLNNPKDRSILATSRQFRTEGSLLFWKDARFILQISEPDPRAGIKAFVGTIGAGRAGLIENLSLYRGPKPYLTYDVPGTRPSVQMEFYRNLTQQFPNLKDFRIEHNEVADYQWGGSNLNACWAERVKDAAFLNEIMVLVQVKDIRTVHGKELVDAGVGPLASRLVVQGDKLVFLPYEEE